MMMHAWGNGRTGEEFLTEVETQIESVMSRLQAFGTPISAEEFKGASKSAVKGHSSLDSPRLFIIVPGMNVLGMLSTCGPSVSQWGAPHVHPRYARGCWSTLCLVFSTIDFHKCKSTLKVGRRYQEGQFLFCFRPWPMTPRSVPSAYTLSCLKLVWLDSTCFWMTSSDLWHL